MASARVYAIDAPARSDVDAMPGLVLLEFGTGWCGHCGAAAPHAQRLLEARDEVRHLRIEDGPGRPLGRSFRVKLWPTFVLLRDGVEQARVVGPRSVGELEALFDAAAAGDRTVSR